jgi:RNA polymerase sigma-70 factor (ECF subfamily)
MTSKTTTDEQELLQRMRRGDQRAFNQFFDAYAARLGSFAARRSSLDAASIEDVVQTTMINAMRNLGSFRGDSTLFTWLCQICRNQLADIRRKQARQPQVHSLEQMVEEKPRATVVQLSDFRDPLDECATDAERGAVRRAINRLPSHYARMLELRFGDELTVPEIARVLQVSESAAESQLVRARAAFRAEWQGAAASAAETR